jgi:hypothetical protein
MAAPAAQSMLERLDGAGHSDLGRAIRRALSAGARLPFAMKFEGRAIFVTEDFTCHEAAENGPRLDRIPAADDKNERKRRSFRCLDEVWDAIPEPKASWVEEVVVEALEQRSLLR